MYVTAMWVRRGDDMGINVFVHRHDTDELVDWLEENGERWWTLPEDFPGEADRGASSFALKPGGNSVQAYMDVILRDRDWTLDAVRKALDALD